jgi:hypothetical protein
MRLHGRVGLIQVLGIKMKIRPASRKEEKQTLLGVLGSLDGEYRNGWRDRVKRELGVLSATFILVVIMLIIQGTQLRFTLTVAVLGFVAGIIAGVLAYRLQATRLWPVIAKHVDRSGVEARLRELDA